jgi:hypothetical protein
MVDGVDDAADLTVMYERVLVGRQVWETRFPELVAAA